MDIDVIIDNLPRLLSGASISLQLLGLSVALGLVLAVVLAMMRVSGRWWLTWPAQAFMFFFRGTPLLVQLFLIYYGLGQFEVVRESPAWPILRQAYWCAVITLTLNTGAYTAEILRGAILGVERGEVEAARAFGFSGWRLYRRIVLPQAFRIALPAYVNEVILLLKGSALVFTITVMDLMGEANRIYARTFQPYEPFIAAGILYLLMTLLITWGFTHVERWLFPDRAPARRDLLDPRRGL